MMKPEANITDGKEDPDTELGLFWGYSTMCNRTAVRNDPSAGANAGSLSFVAANPVSELVWSAQGLTLKYADCSFMERKLSCFLGVGPSNMVMSTSHDDKLGHANIPSTKGDMVSPEGNGPTNEANANGDAADVGGSRNENSNHYLHDVAETASKPEGSNSFTFPGQNVGRIIELLPNEPDLGGRDCPEKASGLGSKKPVKEGPLGAALSLMDKDTDLDGGILSRLVENDQLGNPRLPLSEKLESMDENDVREPDSQIAGGAEVKFAASETCYANQVEMPIPQFKHSPENSGVVSENHPADKGRASFNTDAVGRLLKEKSDSRDSVESYNRAMVTKKRWRFDEPMFIGSKRAKQIHSRPSSSSFSGQNSSFMNWISNMMKGLSRPTIDAGVPLSFAFADPSNSPGDVAHSNISEQKNVRHTGFQSFFQKIYQPNLNASELGLPISSNEANIGSGVINEACAICADPTSHHEGTDDVSKQPLLSNKEFNEDTPVVGPGPSPPLGTHGRVSAFKGIFGADSDEDNVSVSKNQLIRSSSPSEEEIPKTDSTEDKAPQCGNKGDFRTLWINHFSSKASCSLLKMEEAAQIPGGATDGCHNSIRTSVQLQQSGGSEKNVVNGASDEFHNEKPLGATGNKLPHCHVVTQSSVGFTRAGSCSQEDTVRKVDEMLPTKCLKNSEEMASTFAQRLDALRRNIPPIVNVDSKANVLCFFCGMLGHQLRVCTKVAKSDLKGLLTAGHPHEARDMSPACIKCFQLNHWAVSCPHKQVQDSKRDGLGFWVRHGISDANSVQNERTHLKNCHMKGNRNLKQQAVSASGTLTRAREDEGVSTATNQKDQTKINAGYVSVVKKTSEVPKGIFDMIKVLRLSRTDIIKWMNSGASVIHLEGYFLRLRLGKWGDGLGGSGYRVACLSGMSQVDKLPTNGKIFVSVNVGGINCLVGSQYISNHNFLEDELKLWWMTAAKGGGRMPSEDDLRFKAEEKRRLGI